MEFEKQDEKQNLCEYFVDAENIGKYCTNAENCPYGDYKRLVGSNGVGSSCIVEGNPKELEMRATVSQE